MATTQVTPQELSTSETDQCLCGQPGCLGHERVPGKIYVPGFTSQGALAACPNEIVVFDRRLKPHVLEAILTKLT
jgi:hypothetical protein